MEKRNCDFYGIKGGNMNEMQTISYPTNLKSLKEIECIRKILDGDTEVEYWYLDINNPENKLTLMGKHLKAAIDRLKERGYIVEID